MKDRHKTLNKNCDSTTHSLSNTSACEEEVISAPPSVPGLLVTCTITRYPGPFGPGCVSPFDILSEKD